VRDVGHVHDGFAVQTNLARENGRRSVVLSVMKTGDASTIEVANRVRALLPTIKASAPEGHRGAAGRGGDRRLPDGGDAPAVPRQLAHHPDRRGVDPAVGGGGAAGAAGAGAQPERHDPGRLALALGILLDDATVEIENIHRHLAMGKTLTRAILDGAQQIALPAFVASLSIGVVFVSGTQVDLIEAERSSRDAATAVAVATVDRDRTRLVFLLATGRLPFPK
jgi:hypothetical protein